MKKYRALQYNERFTKFRKKDLIKMWRTLKAESGYRMTIGIATQENDNAILLVQLMNEQEERVVNKKRNKS